MHSIKFKDLSSFSGAWGYLCPVFRGCSWLCSGDHPGSATSKASKCLNPRIIHATPQSSLKSSFYLSHLWKYLFFFPKGAQCCRLSLTLGLTFILEVPQYCQELGLAVQCLRLACGLLAWPCWTYRGPSLDA